MTIVEGRGALTNRCSRFAVHDREPFDDGWPADDGSRPCTELAVDSSRSIISYNQLSLF